MTPIRFHFALLLLVAAPLAECASPAGSADPAGPAVPAAPAVAVDPAPAATPVDAPDVEGIAWQLVAFRSGDALVEPQAGRRPARFELELGQVAGSAGCNRLIGGYTLAGDRLAFEPKMASTMMACPEPLMAQDKAVGEAFAQVARVRRDGELLELLDAADRPVLRFVRIKPQPLTGQVWGLVGYNNGRQAIVSPLAGTEISLELRDDGTLGGFDGCNRFMSGYTLEGGKLAIGPLATTRMACRGPQGAAEQAAAFAAALARVVGYRIEDGELTLLDGDGTPAARFAAAAAPAAAAPRAAIPAATATPAADLSDPAPGSPAAR